jgi:hypothetical protein
MLRRAALALGPAALARTDTHVQRAAFAVGMAAFPGTVSLGC